MNDAPPARLARKIIHVDMDAFYASVEQRDDPELRGQAGRGRRQVRGVVAAASYEARKFGVRSAMPSVTAKRRCPELIFVKPRFDAYREVSHQIRAIFPDYTPLVEPLSLDEAYLDVTEDLKGIGIATRIAEEIRARIRAETGLTASAGVSYNKFLAKLASDQNKPDGLCVVTPGKGEAFVAAAAGQALPRHRPEDGREDGAARHRDRRRPARPEPRLPHPQFRQLRRILFQSRPRHLPPPGQARPALQIDRRRGHLLRGSDRRGRRCSPSSTGSARPSGGGSRRRRSRGRTVTSRSSISDFRIVTRARSLDRAVAGREEFLDIGGALLRTLLPSPRASACSALPFPTCTKAMSRPGWRNSSFHFERRAGGSPGFGLTVRREQGDRHAHSRPSHCPCHRHLPAPAIPALPTGAAAPDFTTNGALAGKPSGFASRNSSGTVPVVLYFFPKAFTEGCTHEAHAFSEAAADFRKAGARVIGLSADDQATLAKFSVEACRNAFPVATASADTIRAYDVALAKKPELSNRTSYVIAPSGRIAYVYSDLDWRNHVRNTLAAVRALKTKKA